MTKRVMMVENSTTLRQLALLTLQDAGYDVIEATDGMDALTKLYDSNIDMVITNLNMPRMNGMELTRLIRAEPSFMFIPVIFLTTRPQSMKEKETDEPAITKWLTKPFQPVQLIDTVRQILS